jgi:hypothetical protein
MIVLDLKQIARFPYSDNSRLMKSRCKDADKVLELFGKNKTQDPRGYKEFVEKGVLRGKRPELTGGGGRFEVWAVDVR